MDPDFYFGERRGPPERRTRDVVIRLGGGYLLYELPSRHRLTPDTADGPYVRDEEGTDATEEEVAVRVPAAQGLSQAKGAAQVPPILWVFPD
jgi:hypothetical protein